MKFMSLRARGEAVQPDESPLPVIAPGQVLLAVQACGVCRTDLHLQDGELPDIPYPVTPGHEIVGRVVQRGREVTRFAEGDRVGVPWLGWTCGRCSYCRAGQENLCDAARFTGYTLPGGYAEYVAADARFCFPIPDRYTDAEAAPLLCAGLIGYRAYRFAGDARDSASTDSARPRTCSRRSRGPRAARSSRSRSRAMRRPGIRPATRRRLGWRLRRDAA